MSTALSADTGPDHRKGVARPVTDVPKLAAKIATNEYIEGRSKELQARVTQVLEAIEKAPGMAKYLPSKPLQAIETVRQKGASVLWEEIPRLNNLDKSVALDNLDALVTLLKDLQSRVARGEVFTAALDERLTNAFRTLGRTYESAGAEKQWKAKDSLDGLLNEFGAREAVRRDIFFKAHLDKHLELQPAKRKAAIESDQKAALRELERYADSILAAAALRKKDSPKTIAAAGPR